MEASDKSRRWRLWTGWRRSSREARFQKLRRVTHQYVQFLASVTLRLSVAIRIDAGGSVKRANLESEIEKPWKRPRRPVKDAIRVNRLRQQGVMESQVQGVIQHFIVDSRAQPSPHPARLGHHPTQIK
ncbi:hypothetical protein B0T09DRAFT_325140 [Sordaria sp. MPI-SDFR-AT-0083]|nr:hypothetical protein B0T09DRAFT_325140 [Sordaria sp. MPI-SDFR-AT-0083]